MAITPGGLRKLEEYIEACKQAGGAVPRNIARAVALTEEQRAALTAILTAYWRKSYACPALLDIKPQHGYQSRVGKDGYDPADYLLWLVTGCSDVAAATTDPTGRPRLEIKALNDDKGRTYDLVVIVSCDARGNVHINDVIPKGLPPQKKTAP